MNRCYSCGSTENLWYQSLFNNYQCDECWKKEKEDMLGKMRTSQQIIMYGTPDPRG